MHPAIQEFKNKHGIRKISGLMMLHYFKWPWCLDELAQHVDEIHLLLHYAPGECFDWPGRNPKVRKIDEIREDENWKVEGWYARAGSNYQGEFRERALRMLDEVKPDIVLFPDEDESFPEPELMARDLERFWKSGKNQLAFTRCNFWDSMDMVRKDRWIPYKPHVKVYKWREGLTYYPYLGWNCVSTYGKKKMVARSAVRHYAYLEKEERERRFHDLYSEKQDRFRGLLEKPKLVKYINARKAPRT